MDDGAKAAAEAVKAMIPARENFILFKVAMRKERSEQMRLLANVRTGGCWRNHARRKGGVEIGIKSGPVGF